MNFEKLKEDRYTYNKRIVELLTALVEKYKDLRFCQLLWALEIIKKDKDDNIIDNFHEEPNETFERIKNEYKIIAQEIALDILYPNDVEPKDVYEKVLEKGLQADIQSEIENDILK